MLDIVHICKQIRENQWLKETLLTKIEVSFVNENYKKVINPFVEVEKTSLSAIEK